MMCGLASVIRSSNSLFRHCNYVYKYKSRLRYISNAVYSENRTEGLVKRKFTELVTWYEEITGMDEVRIAQNRVLDAEEKFITAQERRREANTLVSTIQNKLKELYAELDNTTRGEERYVHLITQEHTILKEERKAVDEFQRYEREERDYFAALSSAVKESHEKERAQAERTKYWSVIGSIIGTIIGVVGSSINSQIKMKELRGLVKESLSKSEDHSVAESIPESFSKNVLGQLSELVHTLDNKMNGDKEITGTTPEMIDEVLKSLKKQENSLDKNFRELKSCITSRNVQIGDEQLVVLPYGFEERLHHQQQTLMIIGCCTVASIVIPLLCKYFGL